MTDAQGPTRGRIVGEGFARPSSEALKGLARELNLDDSQARELGIVLYHVDEDFKAFRGRLEGRQPRKELVRRLGIIAKLVGDLAIQLRNWEKTLADFLPEDAREEIGVLMSFSAMEAALKRELRFSELQLHIEELADEDPEFRMAQLEERLLSRRQARGLEHGGELLTHFVERINGPIKAFFELDRLNRGGRPSTHQTRDYLLRRLAEAGRAVIGVRPSATAGGRFARLCVAVFAACGVDDTGIERAIERTLEKLTMRGRSGRGFREGQRYDPLLRVELADQVPALPGTAEMLSEVLGMSLIRRSTNVLACRSRTVGRTASAGKAQNQGLSTPVSSVRAVGGASRRSTPPLSRTVRRFAENKSQTRLEICTDRMRARPPTVREAHILSTLALRISRRSKASSPFGEPSWATRSTPSCATRVEA